jgi:hypothetical protein
VTYVRRRRAGSARRRRGPVETGYGLVTDFAEEIRLEGGEKAIRNLYRSAEAHLRMWERVVER